MGRWHNLSILFHKEAPHTYPELELLILGDTDKSAMLSVPDSRLLCRVSQQGGSRASPDCCVMSGVIAIQALVLQPLKRQGGCMDMNKDGISPGKAQLAF